MSTSDKDLPGFSPILNPLDLAFSEPFELLPHHFIQRAAKSMIRHIQRVIVSGSPHESFLTLPVYECELIEERTQTGGVTGKWVPLPEEKWRYNVLSYVGPHGQSDKVVDIELVSNVSEVPLELPVSFLNNGVMGHAYKVSHFLLRAPNIPCRTVTQEMLRDVRAAYDEFLAVREQYPEIARALRLLEAIKGLPPNSEFEVLGLFAIIEMLITHNPKLEDVGDSITHQMKGKLPLLSRRFRRPLDYGCFGSDIAEDKIWARLYALRSNIAHGGTPDFNRGDLSALKSRQHAIDFLRTAVRCLIRHSFKEPQLYRDLKAC